MLPEINPKLGDTVEIMITGMIGHYTAKVIDFDKYGEPILKELNDPKWPKLKYGDYIIMSIIPDINK